MTPDLRADASGSGSDPVFQAKRFLAMHDRPGFPVCLQKPVADLELRCDKLVKGDREGWLAFYEDVLDIARDAVARLNDDSSKNLRDVQPVKGAGVGGGSGAGPGAGDSVNVVRRYLPDLEKSDRGAIAYVVNERVPKQRNTEIREAIEALAQGIEFSERLDAGDLIIEVDGKNLTEIQRSAQTIFSQWKEKVLSGAVARIQKHREPILTLIQQSLDDINKQIPDVASVGGGAGGVSLKIPASATGKIPSLYESAWRFFRSTLGIVFLAGTLLASFFGGKSSEIRVYVYLVAIPLFLIVAIIQSVRGRKTDMRQMRLKLKAELTKAVETKLREAADNARQDIQAALRKLQAENEHNLSSWWYCIEHQNRQTACSNLESIRPTVESSASSSQVQSLISQITEKIIPKVAERLSELGA